MYECMYVCMYVCIYVCVYVCIYVCVFVCMCVCVGVGVGVGVGVLVRVWVCREMNHDTDSEIFRIFPRFLKSYHLLLLTRATVRSEKNRRHFFRGHYSKTFYGRNSFITVVIYYFYHFQSLLPNLPNFVGK
jgi:hypothetical protein